MKSKGTINKRIINNKMYYYYQYLEDGKQVSKTISEEEAYGLAFDIYFTGKDLEEFKKHDFKVEIVYGSLLYQNGRQYRDFNKRFCYGYLESFLTNPYVNKVCGLYGLRRTGKTTLMFQTVNSFSFKEFSKCAYIKCTEKNTFRELTDELKYLVDNGFKYIFIDEVTLLSDFMALASVISDIYGLMAKIVLSGTDSLGFIFASHHELYDRIKLIHTTYIPYHEFASVLNMNSLDQYIEYGGTMSYEGVDYNNQLSDNSEAINEYIDSAISHNIVHSLKYYKDGDYFASLYELYEKGELQNVINRIIEDTNHRFAISVIQRDFKSHDYGSLKQLIELPSNYQALGGSLDDVDEEKLTSDFMNALEIINKDKQTRNVDENVLTEINYYLTKLDVSASVKEVVFPSWNETNRNVFTQPGLRYSQAKTLLQLLMNDDSIKQYSEMIKDALKEKLLSDVKGRMLEDIVLLEVSNSGKEAFKLKMMEYGEYDMVILDHKNHYIDIYEIKHSDKVDKKQYRCLVDKEMNSIVSSHYYPIRDRVVLYQGETHEVEGVKYLNISDFLMSL